MKKTFFFNLFPTKAEEDEGTANISFQLGRTLVEIRDLCPPPDPTNPWQIRKQPTISDVVTGRLILSHKETFEHIFRYWSVEMANYVLSGNKAPVVVWDVTEENNPLGYRNDNVYFERGSSEEFYVLGWMELARNRIVSPGDDIGLYWDIRSASFHFKVFQRQAQNVNA
ncbi:hypothetical protein Acr_12g0000470 [Actinidia rufa]|uniref:Uncharacterized protein n=1 Tax=Actinidia rufa TaxID=165716 RepID=A0A7J0FGE7_9ERIC|nr:hypothetical protein Acr_12g0000470 [Actinidia rufa]